MHLVRGRFRGGDVGKLDAGDGLVRAAPEPDDPAERRTVVVAVGDRALVEFGNRLLRRAPHARVSKRTRGRGAARVSGAQRGRTMEAP